MVSNGLKNKTVMLTIHTQAAIALLHDVATGNNLQSANFLLSKEDLSNLLGELEAGGLICRLPDKEEIDPSSYKPCRPLHEMSLLDVLQATNQPIRCNQPTPASFYDHYGIVAQKIGVFNHIARKFLSEIKMSDW